MPLDDPDKIDISLSLMGAESQGAISQLISRMSDLDERLKAIALSPNQAASISQQQRVVDRLRGVVPTGSAAPPQIYLPNGSIYNPTGTGSVSPISESNLRARAKEALGSLYSGVPEGENIGKEGNVVTRVLDKVLPQYQPKGRYSGKSFGSSGGFYDYGSESMISGVSSGASLPQVNPENLPKWVSGVDIQRAQTSFEMPYEGWGALSGQAKLELASDWAARRAFKAPTQAATTAYQQTYQQAYQTAASQLGPGETLSSQQTADINAAATQAATDAFNQLASKSKLGVAADYANRVAGFIPNALAVSSTFQQATGGISSLLGGGGFQNVTAIDPALLNITTYARHPFTSFKVLQALGQQMGAQATNEDINTPFRNFQSIPGTIKDPATQAAINMIMEAATMNRQFSRITMDQALKFEKGIGNYGYSGAQANAISWSGGRVMQNTGLPPDIVSQIYGESLRYGTGTVREVQDSLTNLAQSAKNAHQNLDEYATGLLQYGQEATMNGANSIPQGMMQGRALTNAFPGLTTQDAQGLATNPFIQTMTMMNTGLMPFQQGMLPGAALAQSTQQTVGFYMKAASAFARPSTTHTPFGNITTSARQAQIAAAAGMMGIPAPQLQAILRGEQGNKATLSSDVESITQGYLDPKSGYGVSIDPRNFLSKVNQYHLVNSNQYKDLVNTMNTQGARAMMTKLQKTIEINQGNNQNAAAQGLPGANVKLDLTDSAKQLVQFILHGGKGASSTRVQLSRATARAGGNPSAQAALNPSDPSNIYGRSLPVTPWHYTGQ